MESAPTYYWAMRTELVETLFNDDELFLAEKEARSLLKEPMLPKYYRIHCLERLASGQECAEQIWHRMRLLSPVESSSADDNSVMDELRTMLDELEEDMVADKSKNVDWAECLDGVVVHRLEPAGEEEELEEDIEMIEQKKGESQSADQEEIQKAE
ncbi:hypothetical protein KCU71_g1609, partial [Aureobasidium melanogenum]